MAELSTSELSKLILDSIGYLMVHYRDNIIGLLQQDGYKIDKSANDKKVHATIIAAIKDSEPFRESLAELICQSAELETNNASQPVMANMFNAAGEQGNVNSLFSKKFKNCSGSCSKCTKFKNCSGDSLLDYNACLDGDSNSCDCDSMDQGYQADLASQSDGSGLDTYNPTVSHPAANTSTSGSTFKNIINSGLSFLSGTLNAKTQEATQNAAVSVAAAQAAAAQAAAQAQIAASQNSSTTPGWIWPLVIGLPIVIVGLVVVIKVLRKKKV